MRLDQILLLAGRISAAAAMMSLACSSSSMKRGAGGGGGKGASGGSDTGAAGGGHPGSDGGSLAGAGGGGGAGADAGIDASPLTLPGCLADLLSACPVATPCVSSSNDAGQISNVCFAAAADAGGGARATITQIPSTASGNGDCGAHFTSVTVSKADGSLCYSFEQHEPVEYDCSTLTWTWKDPTGRIVATGSVEAGYGRKGRITCADGGAPTTCTEPYGTYKCCAVSPYGSPACPDGVNVASCRAGTCP